VIVGMDWEFLGRRLLTAGASISYVRSAEGQKESMTACCGFFAKIVLTAALVSACSQAPFVPSPEPMSAEQAVQAALARPGVWPSLPVDPAFILASRRLCLPDLKVNPNLPFVLEDRRELGSATVVFADVKTVAFCGLKRMADGIMPDGGSGTQARWTPDVGVLLGERGLTMASGGGAGAWASMLGLAPKEAVRVRAVVAGRPVDAVLADGIYSVSWPEAGASPTTLVAFDAGGRELSRIDGQALAGLYSCRQPECSPAP
jgi:hypothetical protein